MIKIQTNILYLIIISVIEDFSHFIYRHWFHYNTDQKAVINISIIFHVLIFMLY